MMTEPMQKNFEPKLFTEFPQAKGIVHKFFGANLDTISVDKFRHCFLDKVVPALVDKINSEKSDEDEDVTIEYILSLLKLKTFCLQT